MKSLMTVALLSLVAFAAFSMTADAQVPDRQDPAPAVIKLKLVGVILVVDSDGNQTQTYDCQGAGTDCWVAADGSITIHP